MLRERLDEMYWNVLGNLVAAAFVWLAFSETGAVKKYPLVTYTALALVGGIACVWGTTKIMFGRNKIKSRKAGALISGLGTTVVGVIGIGVFILELRPSPAQGWIPFIVVTSLPVLLTLGGLSLVAEGLDRRESSATKRGVGPGTPIAPEGRDVGSSVTLAVAAAPNAKPGRSTATSVKLKARSPLVRSGGKKKQGKRRR